MVIFLLTQNMYIKNLLIKVKMQDYKPYSNPMALDIDFTTISDDYFNDPMFYGIVVGALQYITLIHPHLSIIVNKCCLFMFMPTMSH